MFLRFTYVSQGNEKKIIINSDHISSVYPYTRNDMDRTTIVYSKGSEKSSITVTEDFEAVWARLEKID